LKIFFLFGLKLNKEQRGHNGDIQKNTIRSIYDPLIAVSDYKFRNLEKVSEFFSREITGVRMSPHTRFLAFIIKKVSMRPLVTPCGRSGTTARSGTGTRDYSSNTRSWTRSERPSDYGSTYSS